MLNGYLYFRVFFRKTTPVDDIESTYLMLIKISRTNSMNVILNLLINQQT